MGGLFDWAEPEINKKIRLIELFAGYGSQAMALERLGVDFEHHLVCEFDEFAIKSYNAVHGTNFVKTDIRNLKGEDLKITEKDKYCYIMTYSFPCTDLSLAGKQKGMSRDSGTRSSLLWETERLLNELVDNKMELPDILLLENVPQVCADKNAADFDEWCKYLNSLGYDNHLKILNAKDYGVAQNRERAFMLSFLGDIYEYEFPKPITLEKRMIDYLESEVEEKYFINSEKADLLIKQLIVNGTLPAEQDRRSRVIC